MGLHLFLTQFPPVQPQFLYVYAFFLYACQPFRIYVVFFSYILLVCLSAVFLPFYKIILLSSQPPPCSGLDFFFVVAVFYSLGDPRVVLLVEKATDFFASHAFDFQMKDKYCAGQRQQQQQQQQPTNKHRKIQKGRQRC